MRVVASLLFLVAPLAACSVPRVMQEPFEKGVYQDILERQARGVELEEDQVRDLPAMGAVEYERLGDTYLQRGELGLARAKYDRSLQLDPTQARVQYKAGILLLRQGSAAEALEYFQRVTTAHPDFGLGHEGVGRAQLALRSHEAAEVALRRAVELDPRLWKAYESLGVLCDRTSRLDESVTWYRRALEVRPGDPSVLNNLGVAHYMRGEYKESISALEAALASAPEEDRARILNNLARSLAKTGAWARAFEAFRKASNAVTAYSNLGLLFLREGQPVRAAACFRRAIEESPRYDASANDNLARARSQMSESEREAERMRSTSASCP